MTYSYTQISQYSVLPAPLQASLPRRLEGERHPRSPCCSAGRSSKPWAAYFQRQDAAAVLYREWAALPGQRSALFRAGQRTDVHRVQC